MKLTVIGGCGSRSLMLAKSLAQQAEELTITEIMFMDNDKERVQIFGSLVGEVFKRLAPTVDFQATTDEKEAVRAADFIITTIRVGKEESRIIDEQIALKHGVIGQETTGVGGFAMALRTVPILLGFCELIKKYANKEVMVFNFSNPAGLVTQVLRNQGYDFVYGICDAPTGFLRQLARLYNQEIADFQVQLIGLNHLSYITSIKVQGREMLEEMLHNPKLYSQTDMRYFEPELAGALGCLLNEYLYYFYYREKALENILKVGETRGERICKINAKMLTELKKYQVPEDFDKLLEIYSHYTFMRESNYMQGETSVARDVGSTPLFNLSTEDEGGYAAVALALMKAKITGEEGEMILCVPNKELLPWLEPHDIIEVTCHISKDGAKAKTGDYNIPESAKQLILAVKYYERTAAEAIVERDMKKAIEALMLHPLVSSYSLARGIVMDYLDVYGDYVGGKAAWEK
jgi:6-phospho-beta-glucosidase